MADREESTADHLDRGVSVLVVDDDAFARASVVTLVERHVGRVAASSATAADALARFRPGVVQVAILDLDLGLGPTGVDLAVQLRKRQPDLALVFLSVVPDPRLIGVDPSLVPAGSVYFVKSDLISGMDLREAVALALLRASGARSTDTALPRAPLTDSQVELLRLLADGYSNREIARRRVVTEAAIERSITRLVHRLGLPSGSTANARVLLVRYYLSMAGKAPARLSSGAVGDPDATGRADSEGQGAEP